MARDELSEVRSAADARDWPGGCRALVAHYRRQPATPVGAPAAQVARAERLLDGSITILNVEGPLAQRADGGVDWFDRGPKDDREWSS